MGLNSAFGFRKSQGVCDPLTSPVCTSSFLPSPALSVWVSLAQNATFFLFFPRRGKGHGFALIKAMTGLTKSGSEME